MAGEGDEYSQRYTVDFTLGRTVTVSDLVEEVKKGSSKWMKTGFAVSEDAIGTGRSWSLHPIETLLVVVQSSAA